MAQPPSGERQSWTTMTTTMTTRTTPVSSPSTIRCHDSSRVDGPPAHGGAPYPRVDRRPRAAGHLRRPVHRSEAGGPEGAQGSAAVPARLRVHVEALLVRLRMAAPRRTFRMIERLLCKLGFHKWRVDSTACGFGFDREFASCKRCPAIRHVDFGVSRQDDIYLVTVFQQ